MPAIAATAALLTAESFAGAVSESFVAFLRPDESSFWRTAPGRTVTVPVSFPEGADAAVLTVTAPGYSARYENITTDSHVFELPEAADPTTENVYDLTLTFNDTAATVQTAKIGLVQGLCPDAEGKTRCLVPAGAGKWGKVKGGRAVLPIPYGITSFTVNGVETETGLGGAQGWYALGGLDAVTPTAVRLEADGETYESTLTAAGGMSVIVR